VRADGFEGSDCEFTNIRAAASKKKGLRVSRLAGKALANVEEPPARTLGI